MKTSEVSDQKLMNTIVPSDLTDAQRALNLPVLPMPRPGTAKGRPAPERGLTVYRQRHPLPQPRRLPVADVAAGFWALAYRSRLLPQVATRRHQATHPRQVA